MAGPSVDNTGGDANIRAAVDRLASDAENLMLSKAEEGSVDERLSDIFNIAQGLNKAVKQPTGEASGTGISDVSYLQGKLDELDGTINDVRADRWDAQLLPGTEGPSTLLETLQGDVARVRTLLKEASPGAGAVPSTESTRQSRVDSKIEKAKESQNKKVEEKLTRQRKLLSMHRSNRRSSIIAATVLGVAATVLAGFYAIFFTVAIMPLLPVILLGAVAGGIVGGVVVMAGLFGRDAYKEHKDAAAAEGAIRKLENEKEVHREDAYRAMALLGDTPSKKKADLKVFLERIGTDHSVDIPTYEDLIGLSDKELNSVKKSISAAAEKPYSEEKLKEKAWAEINGNPNSLQSQIVKEQAALMESIEEWRRPVLGSGGLMHLSKVSHSDVMNLKWDILSKEKEASYQEAVLPLLAKFAVNIEEIMASKVRELAAIETARSERTKGDAGPSGE